MWYFMNYHGLGDLCKSSIETDTINWLFGPWLVATDGATSRKPDLFDSSGRNRYHVWLLDKLHIFNLRGQGGLRGWDITSECESLTIPGGGYVLEFRALVYVMAYRYENSHHILPIVLVCDIIDYHMLLGLWPELCCNILAAGPRQFTPRGCARTLFWHC